MTFAELRVDVVILAAQSARASMRRSFPRTSRREPGRASASLLASLRAGGLRRAPDATPVSLALAATAAVFAGLIVSYLVVLASGLPVLHPEREPVEALAVWTKAIEAAGLAVAAACLRRPAALLQDGVVTT